MAGKRPACPSESNVEFFGSLWTMARATMTDTAPVDSAFPVTLVQSEQILRGEPYGVEHLEVHARGLGKQMCAARAEGGSREFRRRLTECAEFLREARSALANGATQGEDHTGAAWLLDNFHVVDEQLREIVDD